MGLPSGAVTFLFTDIEGSTRLWEQYPETMRSALAHHDALLREAIEIHNGHVFKTVGDAFCAAFHTSIDALSAALASQHALQQASFEEIGSLRVRMALHTGAAEERDNDYFGPALNRVARLLSIGHGEQVLLSLPAQECVQDDLPEGYHLQDMGSHRLRDLQMPEHVFQLLAPGLPSEFPPLRSLQAFANNLPIQLTSFIGREQESEEIKSLLATTRLLSLTGSGGSGKTRLALQVAADLIEEYADGVWLVELAALAEGSLVAQSVASALGLREEPGRSLTQTLTDHLHGKTLLLLLDNCEHLIAACAQLAETLLKACPQVKILATSREALNIGGENAYRVPSLQQPDPHSLPTNEKDLGSALLEYSAVRLFVERARAHRPDFEITRRNGQAVAEICSRLDGIPLAIELAAARIRVLSAEQIAERLDDRFRLLSAGTRTALPRQQTLLATLDWSYALLTKPERLLLARLAVFADGWTLEAAEKVCSDERIGVVELLDLLASLVDKSLVIVVEREGKTRYRMLETIREYGRQRLQESGEEKDWCGRHLDYFLSLAKEAETMLAGAEQAEWLQRLQEENDNLRAGLKWGQQDKDSQQAGLRLAGHIYRFWSIHGYLREGREHLQAALSQEATRHKIPERAKALNGAGILAYRQGDYAGAQALHEESLEIGRELGDKNSIANSLGNLGLVAEEQGDYAAARTLYEQSLAIKRELGDKQGIASVLNNLGGLTKAQGDYAVAHALYEESLVIQKELGNKYGIAVSLHNLGIEAEEQGDFTAARALYEESLAIVRELGDKPGLAASLHNLGAVAHNQGDYIAARDLYRESLEIRRELGDKYSIAYLLESIAALAVGLGQTERAATLWAAANDLREAIGSPLTPNKKKELDRMVAEARTSLGEQAFTTAWERGRAMTIEQAVAYALGEHDPFADSEQGKH